MPRIIVKCHYYKTTGKHRNVGGYLKYIANREGVEKLKDEWKNAPITEKQAELIREIVTRFPSSKRTEEYSELQNVQIRANASEFISSALELHPELLNSEGYLKYMATRPRTELTDGKHGLFSDSDKPLDLESEAKALETFEGNVFTVIVSLKREDASRLGFDNAERWRSFIRANIDLLAEQYGIPKQHLKWYGAFHNESHHPHIHLLLYSTDPERPGFIKIDGINKIRSAFGTSIFQDDLKCIYDKQTKVRNRITDEMRTEFKNLVNAVANGSFINDGLLMKIEGLARRLNGCTGKKQYGYLPKGIKSIVDEIVDEVSKDERITKLYDLWYKAKCQVFETYSDRPPEKKPLSKEKSFKPIRNALVYEAAHLGNSIKKSEWNSTSQNRAKLNGIAHRDKVFNAALRFGKSLSRIFDDNFKKYDPEDDDIDKQLRREIQAVKNGQNLVM